MEAKLRVVGLLAASLTWTPASAGEARPSDVEKAGAEGRVLLDEVLHRQANERAGDAPRPGQATPAARHKVEEAEAGNRKAGHRITDEVPAICVDCGAGR